MNKLLLQLGLLALSFSLAAPAGATVVASNVVRFAQGADFNVAPGTSFTVDLVGENFPAGPDGAAFSLSWNPAVLGYVGASIANPPWDASFISADNAGSGVIDYLFLSKSTAGDAGNHFALASFTFNVLGNVGSSTELVLSNDPFEVGFVAPGAVPIAANYLNSQVHVVPVPAGVWLFGSGLLGLLGLKKRVNA